MEQESVVSGRFVLSVAVVILYVVFLIVVNRFYKNMTYRPEYAEGRRKNSLRLIFMVLKLGVGIVTVLFVMQINNINVSSFVASLGLTSAVLGLGIQDLLRDYITGYNIMAGHYFSVGDTVKYGDFEGTVVYMDMKMTKIQSIDDFSILAIANRNLDKIIRVSHITDIDIPLPYTADFEHCRRTVRMIAAKITAIEGIERAEFKGTQAFGESEILYKLRFFCAPSSKRQIRREVNYIIQKELKAANLYVPFKQVVIHTAGENNS